MGQGPSFGRAMAPVLQHRTASQQLGIPDARAILRPMGRTACLAPGLHSSTGSVVETIMIAPGAAASMRVHMRVDRVKKRGLEANNSTVSLVGVPLAIRQEEGSAPVRKRLSETYGKLARTGRRSPTVSPENQFVGRPEAQSHSVNCFAI